MFELYYNQRIKTYPNGMKVITTFNKTVFNPLHHKKPICEREYSEPLPFGPDISVRLDNLKRAKERVFDIAFMNEFNYFATLTFDDSKVDAYDENAVHRVMKKWFDNMVQRHNCKYLAVPEYHKSGRIHWHMLISGDLTLIDSGTVLIPERDKPVRKEYAKRICHDMSKSRVVYNLKEWKNGFSTVIEFRKCDDGYDGTSAIAKYLTKYITKDLTKMLSHYYYAGGHLERDVPTEYFNVNYEFSPGMECKINNSDLCVKYQTIGVNNESV